MVLCNKTLLDPRGRSREIDQVVVAPHHLFTVEVKSIHGTVSGDEEAWVLPNGESIYSPLSNADQLARMLAGYVRQVLPKTPEAREHFATGLVLLTADTDLRVHDPRRNTQVLRLAEAPEALADLNRQGACAIIPPNRTFILVWCTPLSRQPEAILKLRSAAGGWPIAPPEGGLSCLKMDLTRRPVPQGLVQPLAVVEGEVGIQPG